MYLVRSGVTAGIEKLIGDLGANPVTVFESVGLHPAQLRDPKAFIAYTKLAELLGASALHCRAPAFGLLLVQHQPVAVLGDLPMIASRAGTVEEALDAVDRYLYLLASGVHLRRETRGERVRLYLEFDLGNPPGLEQLMQLGAAHLATFTAGLTRGDRYAMHLHLRQAPPAATAAGDSLRFRSIRYRQDFDGISLPAAVLAQRNHQDDSTLNAHLEAYLQQLQSLYPESLEGQVADIISRLLPTGECGLERVAAMLDMHPRSLQLRLRRGGTAYSALLRQTRHNLATGHLRFGTVSITELALQLGYADVAVFSRHFRQWTGLSPRAWRQRHAPLPAAGARVS